MKRIKLTKEMLETFEGRIVIGNTTQIVKLNAMDMLTESFKRAFKRLMESLEGELFYEVGYTDAENAIFKSKQCFAGEDIKYMTDGRRKTATVSVCIPYLPESKVLEVLTKLKERYKSETAEIDFADGEEAYNAFLNAIQHDYVPF